MIYLLFSLLKKKNCEHRLLKKKESVLESRRTSESKKESIQNESRETQNNYFRKTST